MKTKYWVQAALIAAVYACLTIFLAPISYGVLQVRISEALVVLPMFTPAGVPGLFVGCLIANLLGPYGVMDIVLGSLATGLAAVVSYKLRGRPFLVPLPPIITNALIVGPMLKFVYGVPFSLFICVLAVGTGEAVACYGLGFPLSKILEKYRHIF